MLIAIKKSNRKLLQKTSHSNFSKNPLATSHRTKNYYQKISSPLISAINLSKCTFLIKDITNQSGNEINFFCRKLNFNSLVK